MTDVVGMLREREDLIVSHHEARTGRKLDRPFTLDGMAAAEIERLRRILQLPLTSAELKLVDKHCDWVAFKHAWNAVVKQRLEAVDEQDAIKRESK